MGQVGGKRVWKLFLTSNNARSLIAGNENHKKLMLKISTQMYFYKVNEKQKQEPKRQKTHTCTYKSYSL